MVHNLEIINQEATLKINIVEPTIHRPRRVHRGKPISACLPPRCWNMGLHQGNCRFASFGIRTTSMTCLYSMIYPPPSQMIRPNENCSFCNESVFPPLSATQETKK